MRIDGTHPRMGMVNGRRRCCLVPPWTGCESTAPAGANLEPDAGESGEHLQDIDRGVIMNMIVVLVSDCALVPVAA